MCLEKMENAKVFIGTNRPSVQRIYIFLNDYEGRLGVFTLIVIFLRVVREF